MASKQPTLPGIRAPHDTVFSPCRRYRYYWSTKISGGGRGRCVFVMLNPSTANEVHLDPTVRRCLGFAKTWGHAELAVVNLFAWRSTDPVALYTAEEPVGAANDFWITTMCAPAERVVCAWGVHGAYQGRGEKVRGLIERPHVLRLNRDGTPAHPLYLPGNLEVQPWT